MSPPVLLGPSGLGLKALGTITFPPSTTVIEGAAHDRRINGDACGDRAADLVRQGLLKASDLIVAQLNGGTDVGISRTATACNL